MSQPTRTTTKRRGTQRQQKLARELIENAKRDKPLNAGQILENVGYAKNTAEANPGEIIASEGVKTELAILGFSVDKAKEVVGSILSKETAQDKDRLKAADMVFDVFGTKAPLKTLNVQVNLENKEYVEAVTLKANEQLLQRETDSNA